MKSVPGYLPATACLPACFLSLLLTLQVEYELSNDLRSFGRGFTVLERSELLLQAC